VRRQNRCVCAPKRGTARPEFDLARDRRSLLPAAERAALFARIALYEAIQELHRRMERIRLLATAAVDHRLLADLCDLPRLEIGVDASGAGDRASELAQMLDRCGLAARVRLLRRAADVALFQPSLVALTSAEADRMTTGPSSDFILIADRAGDASGRSAVGPIVGTERGAGSEIAAALAAKGYQRILDPVPLFMSAGGAR
jgi:hypothetical protein